MRITIDTDRDVVTVDDGKVCERFALGSAEGFARVSEAWLRAGWDAKHVYSFTWFGRPVIQLPEDLIRAQEAIYGVRPDVIIETGVAHGGSLVFYASLCEAMGNGRVIGVDVEIRPHNREAIEAHDLFSRITLIEGESTDSAVVDQVRSLVAPDEAVFVVLDSGHSRDHVLKELRAYGDLVSPGSYLVAADGIMRDLVGAPRTADSWSWDNPRSAVEEFLRESTNFVEAPPAFAFNEGAVRDWVTYWKGGWLKRV